VASLLPLNSKAHYVDFFAGSHRETRTTWVPWESRHQGWPRCSGAKGEPGAPRTKRWVQMTWMLQTVQSSLVWVSEPTHGSGEGWIQLVRFEIDACSHAALTGWECNIVGCSEVRSLVFPVHAMKEEGILNLGTRWRWVVNLTHRPSPPPPPLQKEPSQVPNKYEAGYPHTQSGHFEEEKIGSGGRHVEGHWIYCQYHLYI
jgi:hypothetical protein